MKNKITQIESLSVPVRTQSGARKKLRRRSAEEKRRIVEETLSPGASVSVVARRHDVNANQVFMWRRQYRAGKLGSGPSACSHAMHGVAGFIPVGVVDGCAVVRPALPPSVTEGRKRRKRELVTAVAETCWRTEVELRNGVKARFGGGADEKDMRLVLQIVRELA